MNACDVARSLAGPAGNTARSVAYAEGETIFAQGDDADSVFYIRRGWVKLTIVFKNGKGGVVAVLKAGQFFGESCIIGHTRRVVTATVMTPCSLMRIEKAAMVRQLNEQPTFAAMFVSLMVHQSLQYQQDLVDHLFNSAEK